MILPKGTHCFHSYGTSEDSRFSFPKTKRIRKRTEYQRIRQNGQWIKLGLLHLCYKKNSLPTTRVGLVVSKKVGNAVVRNRLKRLLREGFRQHKECFAIGIDVVIVAKPLSSSLAYKDIVQAFEEYKRSYDRRKQD